MAGFLKDSRVKETLARRFCLELFLIKKNLAARSAQAFSCR
jgi:hypothetical protein